MCLLLFAAFAVHTGGQVRTLTESLRVATQAWRKADAKLERTNVNIQTARDAEQRKLQGQADALGLKLEDARRTLKGLELGDEFADKASLAALLKRLKGEAREKDRLVRAQQQQLAAATARGGGGGGGGGHA